MAKVIIGIHGLGNKPSKETLQNWWKESMIEGLTKTNQEFKFPKFELIYWADILHEKPLNEKITNINHPLYLKEIYVSGNKSITGMHHPVRKKVLDWFSAAADKIFLNDDMTVNYSFISNSIIHNYFKDLEAYYENEKVTQNGLEYHARDYIRKRVTETLLKYKKDDIFIVAHSMGTIIAYDILTFILPDFKINTFATIGSPLGIPFVRSRIALEQKIKLNNTKLKTPPGVHKNWYNFSDLEDDVAINYSLKNDFDENNAGIRATDFIVNTDYEIDGERNPHKSFGYLRTPEFSSVLRDFILQKERGFMQRVRDFFGIQKKS
ncbi:MAG: hypothetical protein A2W99_00300 [Bacteroidetes bacterium GWF2_33_16]|nr:MAG: hypothetical protein A2X00_03005 [Bacteroidetes bacterium GWE2_32_14]OFY08714.1 MAG: hypothetical protein A2W99_00300 [Bacteroidetes bacterium GWF2_33_16]